jgi:nitroreductase
VKPLSDETIEKLLCKSQEIETQFHLQPTNYFVVTEKTEKEALCRACLKQTVVEKASAIVVFTASRKAPSQHLEQVLDQELESEEITPLQAEAKERAAALFFDTSPLGFGWFGKLIAAPIMRLFTPMPQLPCIHKREWLAKQVMRNASLFWFLAKQEGFCAEFVDTYDEWRVKLALNIPWYYVVVAIVAVDQAKENMPQKTTIPLDQVLHWNK